jgi:hypothetical protein
VRQRRLGRLVLRTRDGHGVIFRDAGVAAAGSRFVFGTASSALAYFTELDPETRLGTLHLTETPWACSF